MKLRMHGDGRKGIGINAMGVAGTGLSSIMVGYLTYCLTTSYAMAGTVVGLITLGSRIFDGITDIIAGFIIDRCNFKIGKARPYDLLNIPMWIFMILCFEVPPLNTVGKIIYILFMYNMSLSICYTFVTVSGTVRLKRTFREDMRAKVLAICSMVTAVTATIAGILTPILIEIFASQPHGWAIIVSIFAVPGIITSLLQFFLLPEMQDEGEDEEATVEKVSFKDSVKAIFQNPYLGLLVIAIMANLLVNTIGGTISTYYFQYNMGNLTLASLIGLFTVASYAFLAVMPLMTRKLGNRKTALVAYAMIAVSHLAKLLMLKNIVWLIICSAVGVVGITLAISVRDMLLIDAMNYGKLKTGVTGEGIYASVRGFSEKLATGLGPFLIGVLLDIGHFDGTQAVQPESATNIITILYTVVPAVVAAAAFVAIYFCRMDRDIKRLEAEKQNVQ